MNPEDEIEYAGHVEIPEGAIACKFRFPRYDDGWEYESA